MGTSRARAARRAASHRGEGRGPIDHLKLKLILLFVGAPVALLSQPMGSDVLFYVGLSLLVIGLALPARPGEALGEKIRAITRHLIPGRRPRSGDREDAGGDGEKRGD